MILCSSARSIKALLSLVLLTQTAFSQDSLNAGLDLIDIARKALKVKKVVRNDSIKSSPIFVSVLPTIGYSIQNGFTAVVISNTSFYVGKKKNNNISTISAIAEYTQFNQLLLPINLNIWSPGNKWNFSGDWRYYNYSAINYGLGGRTPKENAMIVYYDYIRVYQLALRKIAKNFMAGIGYNLDYHWGIRERFPDQQPNNDFKNYDSRGQSVSSGISFNVLFDSRANSNTPKAKEHYANIVYRPNFTIMGSDDNWQSILLDFRTYIAFPKKSKNIIALWNYNIFTLSGNPPYFDLPAVGWDTYTNAARQFRQGRYIGKNLLYFEAEYRFEISKNGLFNGAVFTNAQSVSEWPSNKFKHIVPGIGAGLRTKLNKRSNLNLLLSYGIALDGSQGFFFNLGEVF